MAPLEGSMVAEVALAPAVELVRDASATLVLVGNRGRGERASSSLAV
jgi:hypothetical protein